MILPFWGRIRRQAASYRVKLESYQANVSKPLPNDKSHKLKIKLSVLTSYGKSDCAFSKGTWEDD